MIDSYLLEQLLAFHKAGTLLKAAEQLHISQPALSQSMKKLEVLINAPLFNRRHNKTTFNDNGLLVVDYAKKILELQNEMLEAVQYKNTHKSTINLAAIAPVPLEYLKEAIQSISSSSTITSHLLSDEEEMISQLEKEHYDLIVTKTPPQNAALTAIPLFTENLSMQVPNAHPLAIKKSLTFDDLQGQNILIYEQIGAWMEMVKSRIPKANLLVMDNRNAFQNIANMGEFPSFISDCFSLEQIPANRTIIPIAEKECQVTFHMVFLKQHAKLWEPLVRHLTAKTSSKALKSTRQP